MTVKEFLKDADPDLTCEIFKSDYDLTREGLAKRLKSFLKNIQSIEPIHKEDGVIRVSKYHDMDGDKLNIYIHSSLILLNHEVDYAYFIAPWEEILGYEVVIEDSISKEEAQANIIFEMTYMGTDKDQRIKRIENMFSEE